MSDQFNDIESITIRFIQGTCTDEERKQFFRWLHANAENEATFFQIKEIFDARQRMDKPNVENPFIVKHTRQGRARSRARIAWWMRYAAIFAVMFGIATALYMLEKKPAGESVVYVREMVVHNSRGVYQLVLPDSSRVWLHGGTTITYPEQFSDSIRTVDLQGEAYFAVQADITHPFVVQTSTAKIRATGTEFNITAYPSDMVTTTTLIKGVVNVQPKHLATSVQLKPNQQAVVNANDGQVCVSEANAEKAIVKKEAPVIIHDVNAELYADWKDGVYRFKNEPFQNIVLRLEKMYGVNVRIESEDLKTASFSGMFTTDYSLKEVFEIINISNPISYRVENKVVYIKNKK